MAICISFVCDRCDTREDRALELPDAPEEPKGPDAPEPTVALAWSLFDVPKGWQLWERDEESEYLLCPTCDKDIQKEIEK